MQRQRQVSKGSRNWETLLMLKLMEFRSKIVLHYLTLFVVGLSYSSSLSAQNFIDQFYDNIDYEIEREHFDNILWYTSCASVQVISLKGNNFDTKDIEEDVIIYLNTARRYFNYYYPQLEARSFELVFSINELMSTFYYLSKELHVDLQSYCESEIKPQALQ